MQIGPISVYFAADNRAGGKRGSIHSIFLVFSSSSAKTNQHRSTFFSDVNLLLPTGSQLQTNTFVTTDHQIHHIIDQAACDMARAETIESGGDVGASGGRGAALPRHITCRMELPRSALYLPCPLPWILLPEAVEGPRGEPQPTSPSSSPSSSPPLSPSHSQREERGGGGDQLRGERTDSDENEESLEEASSLGRGPLPDLLPENEHPSWPPAPRHHRAPVAEEAGLEAEARRVGRQLRAIGDDLNAALLHRAAAPQWRDWRGVFQVLINFACETLSTLYRLT